MVFLYVFVGMANQRHPSICLEEWLHPAIKIDMARSNSATRILLESRNFLELQESWNIHA